MKLKLKSGFALTAVLIMHNWGAVMSQTKFIHVNDFDSAYQKNPNLNYMEQKFDLLKILLLDSAKKKIFISHDPELEHLFDQYSKAMTLNKATVGFFTHSKAVSQLFDEPDRILNCFFGTNDKTKGKYVIDHPTYINGNAAIIEISSPSTSDLYYLRYHRGVVQINWLGGVIE